jgi:hypothetical protein
MRKLQHCELLREQQETDPNLRHMAAHNCLTTVVQLQTVEYRAPQLQGGQSLQGDRQSEVCHVTRSEQFNVTLGTSRTAKPVKTL